MFMESSAMSSPRSDVGNRSGRMLLQQRQHITYSSPSLRYPDEAEGNNRGNFSVESLRAALWEREKSRAYSEYDL